MNLMLWLYAIDVADALNGFFKCCTVVLALSTFIGLLSGLCIMDSYSSGPDIEIQWKKWRKCMAFIVALFVPSLFLYIVIPSQKTMYLMLGAKTAEEIVLNPQVRETGGKVMALINKKLEDMTADGEAKKEKK